jgi:hypothetical protein
MTIEIQVGQQWRCVRSAEPFYTAGKTYEVMRGPTPAEGFQMTDNFGMETNGGTGHTWVLDAAFCETFVLATHDAIEHPSHYTGHPSGVECIQITEHMNFCRGNAVKYIWRAGEKGDEIEDLKKARWYIDREIARLTKKSD